MEIELWVFHSFLSEVTCQYVSNFYRPALSVYNVPEMSNMMNSAKLNEDAAIYLSVQALQLSTL